ncbi:hypothetical protein EDC17_103633 [Sphingobacterium alimentarium]|uniref:Uncharacterized protein n=1 Tax=Sphingobacterium alimentarium TaxID=797292 RepID=A0A4R3VR60_9SPHI|nr:hypothetical protein [Sphingobacterium alimentarium]TCV10188.1 hypothetical protein EDC17_103633 [Sphingobacterium alimentarium]
MATIHEDKPIGREMHKDKKEVLTKDGHKKIDRDKKIDGDAEAGVDPQVDQINDMPNDPTDMPKEKE